MTEAYQHGGDEPAVDSTAAEFWEGWENWQATIAAVATDEEEVGTEAGDD